MAVKPPNSPPTQLAYKVCLFGEGGVGKTSLTKRYLYNKFDLDTLLTMGANIFIKTITIKNISIILQIWDFGGEQQFRFMLPAYARGSSGGIFMFDLTRQLSLVAIKDWLAMFKQGLAKDEQNLPIFMVGAKQDLKEKRSVLEEDARALAKKHGLVEYMECSAKSGYNVDRVFEQLALTILKANKII